MAVNTTTKFNPVDIIIAVSEAVAAGAASFAAAAAAGAPAASGIVSGAVSFLSKLMPTNLFNDDQTVTTIVEAVIAGGTAYVATSTTGASMSAAIIAGVVALLTKLAPTKLILGIANP